MLRTLPLFDNFLKLSSDKFLERKENCNKGKKLSIKKIILIKEKCLTE